MNEIILQNVIKDYILPLLLFKETTSFRREQKIWLMMINKYASRIPKIIMQTIIFTNIVANEFYSDETNNMKAFFL